MFGGSWTNTILACFINVTTKYSKKPYSFFSTSESRSKVLPQITKNKENKEKMKEKEHKGKQQRYVRGTCLVVICQKSLKRVSCRAWSATLRKKDSMARISCKFLQILTNSRDSRTTAF